MINIAKICLKILIIRFLWNLYERFSIEQRLCYWDCQEGQVFPSKHKCQVEKMSKKNLCLFNFPYETRFL